MQSVLIVCLGNICRSPAAQGVLTHFIKEKGLEDKIHVESCGLGNWHVGKLPDSRMRETAQTRGFILASRAQEFKPEFFYNFDYILAVDHIVLHELHQRALNPEHKAKVHLLTHFSPTYKDQEIPDPYFGSTGSFDLVMDMIQDSCEGFLENINQ